MEQVRLPCWSCGATVAVDERTPADGLRVLGWTVVKGESYCGGCAVRRGLKESPVPVDDGPPIGLPLMLRADTVPEGPALLDSRTRAALARYRDRGWWWIIVGAVALTALLIIGRPPLPAPGETLIWEKLWDEGLCAAILAIVAGGVVFHRARRWRSLLGSLPWRHYRSRFIAVWFRRGRSGLELRDPDDVSAGPLLLALSSGIPARKAAVAARREVWAAIAPTGEAVVAVPGTLQLFGATPPTGWSCRALRRAYRRGQTSAGFWTRRLRYALYALAAAGHIAAVVVALTHRPPGPDGPIPIPSGTSPSLATPATGIWAADGIVTSSMGSDEQVGERFERAWSISRQCAAGSCAYDIVRQTGGTPLRARLRQRGNLWYARFAPEVAPCAIAGGRTIYWDTDTRFLLRFSPDGRTVTATERTYAYTPACGYGLVMLSWTGALSAG